MQHSTIRIKGIRECWWGRNTRCGVFSPSLAPPFAPLNPLSHPPTTPSHVLIPPPLPLTYSSHSEHSAIMSRKVRAFNNNHLPGVAVARSTRGCSPFFLSSFLCLIPSYSLLSSLLHPPPLSHLRTPYPVVQGVEMSVDLLLPLLTLSHTARDATKVFKFFEAMLEVDITRQGWAYTSVRQRGRGMVWEEEIRYTHVLVPTGSEQKIKNVSRLRGVFCFTRKSIFAAPFPPQTRRCVEGVLHTHHT